LLAEDWLKADARVGEIPLPVALNTNPVHRAAERGLIFTRRGDIVFGMTRDHARFASGAAVQIHHHRPLVRHRISPSLPSALGEAFRNAKI
jgi:hypothetical protein